jgi:F420-dependent methylenetetrahydromethanopterin dehydrogenase
MSLPAILEVGSHKCGIFRDVTEQSPTMLEDIHHLKSPETPMIILKKERAMTLGLLWMGLI